MKLVAADTTSWEWKSEKERERERFCLRGVIFVLHKIFKTPAFILIAAGLCVVTGMCEWSLYQSAYRLRVSDGFNVCVRARSAQRETERARNFGDCVNEERRGEGGWGVGLNPRWMKQPSVILHHSYETRGGGTCLGGEWTMSGRREKREAVNFQPKWGGTNLLVFSLEILAKQHLMQSLVSSNSLVLPFSTFLLFPVIQAWFFISLLRLHPLVLVPFVLHACTFYLIFSLSFFSLLVSSPLLVCILSRLIDCVLIFHLTLSILCSLFSLIYFCFLLSDILLFFSIPPLFSCSVLVFFPLYFNFSISFVYPFHSLLFSLPSLIFPFLLLFLTLTISTPILTTISPCLFSIFSHPPFSPSCLLYASVLWPLCPYLSHFFFTVFYSLIISSSFHFLFQLLAFSLCPPALLTFSPFSSFHSRSKSLLSTPYFFLFPPAPSLTHNFSTISPLNARYQLLSLP